MDKLNSILNRYLKVALLSRMIFYISQVFYIMDVKISRL